MYRIVPDTAPTVNLEQLKEILLSTNEEELKANEWIFEGCSKFLDQKGYSHETVAYASYPRTGNTFLRMYLEEVTGTATGSDMPLSVAFEMQLFGLKGEDHTGNSVWIAKTHHPLPTGLQAVPITTSQIITCVRNPFDAIISAYHHCATHTQSFRLKEGFHLDTADFFDKFVLKSAEMYKKYIEVLIKDAKDKKVALHILRFEDLLEKPCDVLGDAFKFILKTDSIAGKNIERRI